MSATIPAPELSDDLRALMLELTGFAGSRLEGVDRATGTAKLDEYARQLALVRALWGAAETGRIPEEHLANIVGMVRDERVWRAEEIVRQCDDLQTFIIREDPDLRFHDDRAETLATYRRQIADHRLQLRRCDAFLAVKA